MNLDTQTILGKSVLFAINYGAKSLCNKIQNSIFEKEEIGSLIFNTTDFSILLERDSESIEEKLSDLDKDGINLESVAKFFKYPDIEGVVRQIYAANLYDNSSDNEGIKEIEREFTLLLSQYFNFEEELISGLASLLFSILVEGCQVTLSNQISNRELIAFEAMSTYNSKIILDELAGIKENIKFLLTDSLNIKEVQSFFERYRVVLREEHKRITVSTFEGSVRIPIEDIYVCPNFIKKDKENKNSHPLEFFKFLSKIHRIVLLGDPGNGKTTFTKKLCYELSARYGDRLFAGREIVPFVVTVKDYHAEQNKSMLSIIDFSYEELNGHFQIKLPKGAFEYLLLNGYILLIFDGLDELLDMRFREEIVHQIESFCTLYPSVPVIVTSRKIGYEEAALREDMFDIYEMSSFNEEQIKEYVKKWFDLDPYLRPKEKIEKAKNFMKESEKVSDLRSNSLMLSLMCNVYRQENYIPENRPKIYQKCSETLFHKWDKRRGIYSEIKIQDTKIESLISYLAHWIYTTEFSKGGVSEEKLIKKSTEYLYGSTYDDFDEAEKVAKEFVKFTNGRAWVFTDVGTSRDQCLYQFTHRTFLEYFTAKWLCRKYEETNELARELIPKIRKKEWDLVVQLAFQIRGESSEDATDKILITILKDAKESGEVERKNLLSFAARSLGFMIPSPNVVKDVTKDCFEFSLCLGKQVVEKVRLQEEVKSNYPNLGNPYELIQDLQLSSKENRTKIVEILKNLIMEHIKHEKEYESILAAEIIFELSRDKIGLQFDEKENSYWSEISDMILKDCYEYNISVFEKDVHLCIQLFYRDRFPQGIETFLKLHGLEGILYDYSNFIYPKAHTLGIGETFLRLIFPEKEYNEEKEFNSYTKFVTEETSISLKQIGEFCLEFPLPINPRQSYTTQVSKYYFLMIESYGRNIILSNRLSSNQLSIIGSYSDPTVIFGAFCLLAILFELYLKLRNSTNAIVNFIYERKINPLTDIFLVWLGCLDYEYIKDELKTIGFTDKQQHFVESWAQKNICFLSVITSDLESI